MSDQYDRIYGQLKGAGLATRPSTIVEAMPIAGEVTSWIIESMLADRDTGNTVVFLQSLSAGEGPMPIPKALRLVLPPKVVATIVRQHTSLKERAADRRSSSRKAADIERAKIQAARSLLERKRAERKARREASNA